MLPASDCVVLLCCTQGGYFKAKLKFPETYPMEPPTMTMLHPMWHPNIFPVRPCCPNAVRMPLDAPLDEHGIVAGREALHIHPARSWR